MSSQRAHYVTTTDGVAIGGAVHGQGPALVFLQGIIGDGDIDWARMLEHLTGRFTCHLPSLRGRGLSGDHPDLSVGRQVDDVLTYVDSIGEPTGLVGWSGGGNHALGVAARSDALTLVVPFEPVAPSAMDAEVQAALGAAAAEAGKLAADGNAAAAAAAFARWPFNDDEIAAAEAAGYFEAAGRYVPKLLSTLQDLNEHGDPTADPAVLGAVRSPVVVLYGSDTKPVFAASARHVADQVSDARVQEVPGVGNAAPVTNPRALADALIELFASAQEPA